MGQNHYIRNSLQRITQRILTGTFLVFPFTATLIVLFWIVGGSDKLVRTLANTLGLPSSITWNPIISVVLALFLLYVIGGLSTFILVRRLIAFGESLVRRIPVVNFVYNTTKQIVEAISLQSRQSFKKVVMVEYPRKGIYALAFMTGQTPRADNNKEPYINVFLPTTPNPTSGFFLLLPRTEVRDTNLTIQEGVKMIISGGILTPKPLDVTVITLEELEQMRQSDEANPIHAAEGITANPEADSAPPPAGQQDAPPQAIVDGEPVKPN